MNKKKLYYLATPYSKWPTGINNAWVAAASLCGRLLEKGVLTYSPIAHGHALSLFANVDPFDYGIWLPYDEAMMERSDGLLIATYPGWNQSTGIKHEIDFFTNRGIGPMFVDPDDKDLRIY